MCDIHYVDCSHGSVVANAIIHRSSQSAINVFQDTFSYRALESADKTLKLSGLSDAERSSFTENGRRRTNRTMFDCSTTLNRPYNFSVLKAVLCD